MLQSPTCTTTKKTKKTLCVNNDLVVNYTGLRCRKEPQTTYQIYCFCPFLRGIITPRFTPKPFLREWFNWHLMDHVIGQILFGKKKIKYNNLRFWGKFIWMHSKLVMIATHYISYSNHKFLELKGSIKNLREDKIFICDFFSHLSSLLLQSV